MRVRWTGIFAKSPARKALVTNKRGWILPLRCEAKDFSFQQFAIRLWAKVPARLRIVVTATHQDAQIKALCEAIKRRGY